MANNNQCLQQQASLLRQIRLLTNLYDSSYQLLWKNRESVKITSWHHFGFISFIKIYAGFESTLSTISHKNAQS
jgi:hypothetical protein